MTEAARHQAASAVEIADEMQALAEKGEWTAVHGLNQSLRSAIVATPERDRLDMLVSVQRSNKLIAAMAAKAHREIRSQISTIRRGQDAADAYDETHRLSDR